MNTALRRHSPGAPGNARFGTVAFLHRAGSSLNEHPHLHSTATDGVFAPDEDGQARFFPATDLTTGAIRSLQKKLRIPATGCPRHWVPDDRPPLGGRHWVPDDPERADTFKPTR